ncbi:hypothetical protein PRK78_002912 [Emydomyces testavorans]|uniref:Centromere protein Cenp-O n=1 Tax=Emydomyces testavorans TaxID=2070801 RepID=A0AAF0IGY9_9EURO|nr:hypothetical protein PRK78_002912 [Emydomyces testavorans]
MEQTSIEPDPSLVLDEEISKIGLEIRNLTKRRRVLSASLLSSNAIQNVLRPQIVSDPNLNLAPVVLSTETHAQTNHYRAVFSTTSFSFKDPSSHTESSNLLGIRFDVCKRSGKYSEPYYVLLKRADNGQKLLGVYRHTIPFFIPLKQLEEKYLALPDMVREDQENLKAERPAKQDLRRFVRELRRELVAWHLRRDAIEWLQEKLDLGGNRDVEVSTTPDSLGSRLGISSIISTSLESRYIRFEWRDGRVGRIGLSNRGLVERAMVIRDAGRDKVMENLFLGGDRRIETVIQRLLDAKTFD